MSSTSKKTIDEVTGELRDSILSLKAAGPDGFEGLLRVVLTKLTSIPFRLASSGLQGGIDGGAAFPSDAVCFEAKRYDKGVPRTEVLTKIVDLAQKTKAADRLWILGATTEVNTQLAETVRVAGDQQAISTLILDWTASPLPILAVATAAAGGDAIDFLIDYHDPEQKRKKRDKKELEALFRSILQHPAYADVFTRLTSELSSTTLATQRAIEANKNWRGNCFASASIARERLGQALTVSALPDLPSLRTTLREQVTTAIHDKHDVVLMGGEGQGKSWLAAQICEIHDGIALFASAERFEDVSPKDIEEFIVDLLIEQTGDVPEDTVKQRWRHRIEAWKLQPPTSPLLVVVDGINQRRQIRWDKLLKSLQGRLKEIGGQLVVTSRPQFWQKVVSPGLIDKPIQKQIPEWEARERDQLLNYNGIKREWLDDETLATLRNPRLLAVAVDTLPREESVVWIGLTTDRLLMEHLRASQRENFEPETFKELSARLSDHAGQVLERVRNSSNAPPQQFEEDSQAVIETRFFESLPGPGDTYQLRDEGLVLALGYAFVDQLWQAQRAEIPLDDQITHLIDPIQAMDRSVDVVFASLLVCALDDSRFNAEIFSALLDAFSNLQNVDERRFEEFVGIVGHQAEEFFSTLEEICLERGRSINQDWFVHTAFALAATEDGWKVAEAEIYKWLRCYNADAEDQARRFSGSKKAEDEKHLEKSRDEIQKVLASLSPFESELLDQMTEVSGDIDSLYSLALELLAERPLADFADSFVALGLGFGLDRHIFSANKAFQQLTTFNRIDREGASQRFINSVHPLRDPKTSRTGQWTLVRMLYASGNEAAATEAKDIAAELRKASPLRFTPPADNEWKQTKVADPDVERPVNMDEGLLQFEAIDPESMFQAMGATPEDHRYKEFLPVACRFEPAQAIQKARLVLDGMTTRIGTPLRQVIFNCEEMIPLVTKNLASKLVERVKGSDMIESLAERERNVSRMLLFEYVSHQLCEEEQLACLADDAFGTDFILGSAASIKTQATENIVEALRVALNDENERAAYGILTSSLYGGTPVNPELASFVLPCLTASTSRLRAVAFEFAVVHDLPLVRESHAQSKWTAQTTDEKTFESWFGSLLLIEACANGEIGIEEMLDRVSPMTWFVAVERIGDSLAKPLAEHFLRHVRSAITEAETLTPPALELTLSSEEPAPYPFTSVDEAERDEGRFPQEKSLGDILGGKDDFDERQDRLRTIYDEFFSNIKDSPARLLIQRITIDDLKQLERPERSFVPQLLELLEHATSVQFVWLKNLAFAVANLSSETDPDRAIALFKRALASSGFVTQALGDGLTLEHEAIWSSADTPEMQAFWRTRILSSQNDALLAQEILAAQRYGAPDFIKELANQLDSGRSTLDHAYAITVAGLATHSPEMDEIINAHLNDYSLTGDAAKHARLANDTDQWAQHWVKSMWEADTSEEFWRCLMIAKTAMDARVSSEPPESTKWRCYAPIFRKARKAAIKAHEKSRAKTLAGQPTPAPIFIQRVSDYDNGDLASGA